MYDPDHDASPFKALPPVIVALAAVMALAEAIFQAGANGLAGGPDAIGWRLAAVQRFGFVDGLFERMRITGAVPLDTAWRFVTYPFIHVGLTHALFAIVLLLAIGTQAARVFSATALIVTFFAASIAGAVSYGLVNDTRVALIGAYPAVYGFLGLFTWALWIMARRNGTNPWIAFRLVAVLVGLQIFFFAAFGGGNDLASDVPGFVAGFVLAPLMVPGGLRALRERLRSR